MSAPRTLFEKIWSRHVVTEGPGGQSLLYVDRHLIHDGSFGAFERLAKAGRSVRRPDLCIRHRRPLRAHRARRHRVDRARDAREGRGGHAATPRPTASPSSAPATRAQGIVHVIGPEQGVTQPGILLVCGDSHTSTHGAFGALAFGIGSSEVEHVLATQCLWQRKPKTMRITVDGARPFGVAAKDVILAIIAKIGAAGGVGPRHRVRGRRRSRRCRWKSA